jgi:hypothetical protein
MAQNIDKREELVVGLKVGFNITNVWDSRGQEFKAESKLGFAGGLFMGIPIGKFLGFQPELMISQKGYKSTGVLLGSEYSNTRTTTFLDVPILIQLKPIPFVTLLAGPQFSYLLNQKDKYTFGATSQQQEQAFNNENIRKNILGFALGFDVSVENIVVAARWSRDFQTNNGDGSSTTPRYKNQCFQLCFGILL